MNNKKLTTQEFIERSQKIHQNKYDYSQFVYINSITPSTIICKNHGKFQQRPSNHYWQGCPKCGTEKKPQCKPKTTEKFIRDSQKIHGSKYDYSLVIYTDNKTKIKMKCNRCNQIFEQKPNAHLNGQGCPTCNYNHHKSVFDYKEITKVCKKCGVEKNLNEFYVDNHKNIKYRYYRGNCKQCECRIKVEYRKNLSEKLKEKRRLYFRQYDKIRRNNDPGYKLRKDIPAIIRRSIKRNDDSSSIWNYLPYTPAQLKEHIEKQFDKNMSWNNHGTYWHIDHIKPQILLKYDNVLHPNFLECWSLNNLRPLKAEDNIKKSAFFGGVNYRNK